MGCFYFYAKACPIYPLNPYKTLKIPQNFRALRAKVEGGFYYFQDSEIQNLDRGFYYFQKFSNFGRGFLKKLSPLIRICEFKRVWIHIGVSNDIAVLESLVDSARFYNVFVDRGTGADPFELVLASISSQKGDFRPNLVSVLPSLIRMRGDSFFNVIRNITLIWLLTQPSHSLQKMIQTN